MGIKKRTGFYEDNALKLKKSALELLKNDNFYGANRNFLLAISVDPGIEPDILIAYENQIIQKKSNFSARLALADFLYDAGDLAEAQTEFQSLFEEFPEAAEPFTRLAQIYFKWELPEKIIELYEKAPPKARDDLAFLESASTSYLRSDNFQKAAAVHEILTKKSPRSLKFLKTLAELSLKLGDFEKATGLFHQIIEIDKGAIIEIGQKLKALLEKNPSDFFLIKTLGDLYLKTLKPDLAVGEYQKLFKIAPQEITEVIDCFKKTLDIYPHFPEALLALAGLKISNKELSEAVKLLALLVPGAKDYFSKTVELLDEIIVLCPGQVLAYELLAEINFLEGRLEPALGQIENFLKLNPAESQKVIGFSQKLLKIDPANVKAYYLMAEAYSQQKNFKKALDWALSLNQLDKNNAAAYRIMGDVARAENRLAEAFGYYEKAVILDEFNKELHQKLSACHQQILEREILAIFKELEKNPWRLRLNLDLGRNYFKLGDFDSAIFQLTKAIGDPTLAAEAELYLGLGFFEKGFFEKASKHFQQSFKLKAERRDFKYLLARSFLAFCKENQGKLSEAFEIYEEIVETQVTFLNISKRLAFLKRAPVAVLKCLSGYVLAWKQGKILLAGSYSFFNPDFFEKELKVSFGDTYNNRGFAHFISDELNLAEEEFSLAVQLDPELLVAQNNLALLYLKNGFVALAAEILEKIEFKVGDFYPVKNNLGLLNFIKGDFNKAKNYFLEALKDENNGISWFNLGILFYHLGEVKEAVFSLEKSLELTPLWPVVKRQLRYLKPERGQF